MMLQGTAVVFFLLALSIASTSAADGTSAPKSRSSSQKKAIEFGPHGGEIKTFNGVQAEFVFAQRAVRVYLYDAKGKPIRSDRVRAQLTLRYRDDPRRHRYSLYPESKQKKKESCLFLAIDLAGKSRKLLPVLCAVRGFPDKRDRAIPFEVAWRKPLSPDQLAIHRQRMCPVSGKSLKSRGKPVKVMLTAKQNVFVCCADCSIPLKAMPQKYLARLKKASGTTRPDTR